MNNAPQMDLGSILLSLMPLFVLVAFIWLVVWFIRRNNRDAGNAALNPLVTPPIPEYKGIKGYFLKHYNGDFTLGYAYWVNGVLVAQFGPLLGLLLLPWLVENFPARFSSILVLLITALGIVAWIWAMKGTWASATKHKSRGGNSGWATAAKVFIVLGAIKTSGEMVKLIPSLTEHFQVAVGQQPGPKTELEILADGRSIRLSGGINDGTAEQFSKALALAPAVKTVVLNSNGGWIRQGEMLARIIEERHLSTYVETHCSSACTIAFLAGSERAADPKARIGFHAVKGVGTAANESTEDSHMTRRAYQKANLPGYFLKRISETPSNEMWYPTHDELIQAGVLTRTSFGGESSAQASRITSKEALINSHLKLPIYRTVQEKYPDVFNKIIDLSWKLMQEGKSDAEIENATRTEFAKLSMKLLPQATDETLIAYSQLLFDQISTLSGKNDPACIELLFPSGKPFSAFSIFPKELVMREIELLNRAITEADRSRALKPSEAEVEKFAKLLFANHTESEIEVFVSDTARAANPAAACSSGKKYLGAFLKLPDKQRAQALRVMFSN